MEAADGAEIGWMLLVMISALLQPEAGRLQGGAGQSVGRWKKGGMERAEKSEGASGAAQTLL